MELFDFIQQKIPFKPTKNGWYSGKCMVCNDYKERAGFNQHGNVVSYNCWNCGTQCRADTSETTIPTKFLKVLSAYGINTDEAREVFRKQIFGNLISAKDDAVISLSSLSTHKVVMPSAVSLPPKSFRVCAHDTEQTRSINKYLVSRKIDPNSYPFYFSQQKRFESKVIVPCYYQGELIYWQARSIDGSDSRHDSAPVARDSVFFNMDKLFSGESVLFVTEGIFDALTLDGVAILGSQINESKKQILSKCSRRLVFVIDKNKNGRKVAEFALDNGYEIAFPPQGADDANHSAQMFGKIWTTYHLMSNILTGSNAKLAIKLFCKK